MMVNTCVRHGGTQSQLYVHSFCRLMHERIKVADSRMTILLLLINNNIECITLAQYCLC